MIPSTSRARLADIADELIPAAEGMPSASQVGVAQQQLEVVFASRPDLVEPLQRVLAVSFGGSAVEFLEALAQTDPPGHEALVLTILGGYYTSEHVAGLLGYPGQGATVVVPDVYPWYVDEGLLDVVLERGPIYRPTPVEGNEDAPRPG